MNSHSDLRIRDLPLSIDRPGHTTRTASRDCAASVRQRSGRMTVITNSTLLTRRIAELQRRRDALVERQESLRGNLPEWTFAPLKLVGMTADEIQDHDERSDATPSAMPGSIRSRRTSNASTHRSRMPRTSCWRPLRVRSTASRPFSIWRSPASALPDIADPERRLLRLWRCARAVLPRPRRRRSSRPGRRRVPRGKLSPDR